jgi:haloalkane dehalogenase
LNDAQSNEPWRSLYPFESHWCDVGGVNVHYLDEGEGHPAVMFHGNPTWSFMYRDLVAEVAGGGGRAVAIDNVGCGLSDKPQDYEYRLERHIDNAEALIESLELPEMDLVVHDWGGAIGFGYAARHPAKIRRIVVANSAAFLVDRCPLRIRCCRLPVFGTVAVRGFNAFVKAALRQATAHPERMPEAVRQGYLAPYDSFANRIATLRFVQDIPLSPKHPTWSTVTWLQKNLCKLAGKPMLVCWGMRDFCFTPDFLAKWLEYFPGAQVERYADAGHYLFEDAKPEVVSRVGAFLTGAGE